MMALGDDILKNEADKGGYAFQLYLPLTLDVMRTRCPHVTHGNDVQTIDNVIRQKTKYPHTSVRLCVGGLSGSFAEITVADLLKFKAYFIAHLDMVAKSRTTQASITSCY